MDVFSSKAIIYGLNTKKSDIILNYIIEYCLLTYFPKEFCSDNGPEFKNINMNNFCINNNISYIKGIPYTLF